MATQRFEIPVLADDIKFAEENRCEFGDRAHSCAIARALRRYFHSDAWWGFTGGKANERTFLAVNPSQTRLFVISHDRGFQVEPFMLVVEEEL